MNILKLILTTAPTLKLLNYSFLADEIILTVDFSLKNWGANLFQINSETGKNHSSRYESGLWTMFESKYDATKRECRELLKTLKKVRFWLYEVRFIIEIDVNTLIAQLNRSAADLSEILMIRWLTWIRLFDFDVPYLTRNILRQMSFLEDFVNSRTRSMKYMKKTLTILLMINLTVCEYVQCELTRTMMNSFWKMNILKSLKELFIIWSR